MRTIKLDPDKLFFTSDTHFGHKNIIKYCNRPFKTVEEMNEALIENWNKVVPKDGVVVHCGDFTYPFKDSNIIDQYQKYFSQLKGSIILVRGNHDEIPLGVYEFTNNLGTRSFEIHDQLMFNVDGVGMFASHYPATVFPGQYQVFGLFERRDVEDPLPTSPVMGRSAIRMVVLPITGELEGVFLLNNV